MNDNNIEIKVLTPEMEQEAIELIKLTYLDSEGKYYSEDIKDDFFKRLDTGYYELPGNALVAILDGKIVGVGLITEFLVRLLYVDPSHQRKGIGSSLLSMLLLQGQYKEYYTVAAVEAKEFYEKMGFHTTSGLVTENDCQYYPMTNKKR